MQNPYIKRKTLIINYDNYLPRETYFVTKEISVDDMLVLGPILLKMLFHWEGV